MFKSAGFVFICSQGALRYFDMIFTLIFYVENDTVCHFLIFLFSIISCDLVLP